MPTRAKRPCLHPGCPRLVDHGRCPAHAHTDHARRRAADRDRGSSTERGYTWAWRKAARAFLDAHPLCAYCELAARVTAATCVDHYIPHRGDPELFWDESNWRSACKPCHDAKTAREDGGFGNRAKPQPAQPPPSRDRG